MDNRKDPAENSVVDFVDDEEYYAYKKSLDELEYVAISIYIFATLSLLLYVLSIIANGGNFDWLDFAINIIFILIYYTLGYYCKHKPFSALVGLLAVLVFAFLVQVFFSHTITFERLLAKAIYATYLGMKLVYAKRVENYESKHKS